MYQIVQTPDQPLLDTDVQEGRSYVPFQILDMKANPIQCVCIGLAPNPIYTMYVYWVERQPNPKPITSGHRCFFDRSLEEDMSH